MTDERTVGRGGQVIEAARRDAGLRYSELAEASGLSPGYVHDVCAGRRALGVRAAMLIAPVLGLDARELLHAQVDAEMAAQNMADRTVGSRA